MKEELNERAKEEGWVLNPQDVNPGSKDFAEKTYDRDELNSLEIKNLQAIYMLSSVEALDTNWNKEILIDEILKVCSK